MQQKTRTTGTMMLLILVIAGFFSLVGAASATTLTAGSAQVTSIGNTAMVDLILDEVPTGLSGYNITVELIDESGIATITDVTYPSWVEIKSNTTWPNDAAFLKGSALTSPVADGSTNVNLATITLKALAGGSTTVNVSLAKMSDGDTGANMIPTTTVVPGTFTVLVAPTASFTATPTYLAVKFTDTSTNTPTSWAWDFGDGSSSTSQSPSHTYASAGTYNVKLTATNAAGSNSVTKSVTVTAAPVTPVASFTTSVNYLTVTFTDTSTNTPTSWAWDFGDGSSSTLQSPSHTYASAGTYSVKLTATNAAGSNSVTKSVTVTSAPVTPVASFTTSVNYLAVTFTDTSTNTPTSWAWDFGDGSSSTTQSPSHTYASAGTYTVKLTATNAAGSNSVTKSVTVTAASVAPTAAFSAVPTSLSVAFTDASTGTAPLTYAWDFGDGSTSTDRNPSHTYAGAGTYSVKLTVTNAVGSDDETKSVTVSEAPVAPTAAFTAVPTDLTVRFTDASTGTAPLAYAWDFGDGSTSTDQNPSHTYAGAGTYSVTLTVTNTAGSDDETKSVTVSDATVSPTAAFSAVPAGLTVRFTDASTGTAPLTYAWEFGDGSTSTEASPEHTYAAAGTYTVTLTITNAAGSDDATKEVTVTEGEPGKLTAAFSANVTTGKAPLAVQFTDESTGSPTAWFWKFGDGAVSREQNPVHTYRSGKRGKPYTVSLTVVNADGRDTERKTRYITVMPGDRPEAAFSADITTGTSPLTVTFTDESTGSPKTWFWKFGDGTTSTEQNPVHTYTPGKERPSHFTGSGTAASYTVSLTVTNGWGRDTMTRTRYITVIPPEKPAAAFSADVTTGTSPLTVTFTDASTGSPTAWLWKFGDGTTSREQNPVHVYSSRKNGEPYTVSLTVVNDGGRDTETRTRYIAVDSPEKPAAAFSADVTTGTSPLTVTFTDESTGSPTAWFWKFGDGETSRKQNPVHVYSSRKEETSYNVSLTVLNDGGKDSVTRTWYITVTPGEKLSAAFTADVTSGPSPLTVTFTDESTGSPTAWYWKFGDGTTSTEQNPVHTFTSRKNGTSFTVSLKIAGPGGKDTATKTRYITVQPKE